MERAAAIRKLGKLLGKKWGYQVDDKAPTLEERLAAQVALPPVVEERKKLSEQLEARRNAILAADEEYQNLQVAYRAARGRADELLSITSRYKITVGVSSTMFFHVKAQGDSWEEVINKLTAEKKVA